MYSANNKDKAPLSIEQFQKMFPGINFVQNKKNIRVVDKQAVFDMQFDSEHD